MYAWLNRNLWDRIPDDAPNKDFYRKYVCSCKIPNNGYSIPLGNSVDPELAFLYEPGVSPGICRSCNKLPKAFIDRCKRCTSVYCTLFSHNRQPMARAFVYGKLYCWNCLSAGYGMLHVNKYIKENIPPKPQLLNPVYVKPTFEDMFGESIDDFLNSL